MLWILRALTMRRTSFILLVLAVLFAASLGVPSAHAVRTHGRASSPEYLRNSHNKKKPARKEQAWTGRSTLQPAGRPALQIHAPWVGEDGGRLTHIFRRMAILQVVHTITVLGAKV